MHRIVGEFVAEGSHVGTIGNYPVEVGQLVDAKYHFKVAVVMSDETDLDQVGFMETMKKIEEQEVEMRVPITSSVVRKDDNGRPTLEFTKKLFTPYEGHHDHFKGEMVATYWWVPDQHQALLDDLGNDYLVHPLLCYNEARERVPTHEVERMFQDHYIQVEFNIEGSEGDGPGKGGIIELIRALVPENVLFLDRH
ncbi:hypothetical protein BJ165DRAFT_1410294 [Panaeolus papilionaceus]|nr:hypothetical protein BJ165DRAFT_1410294 [Panaeolus papilionaceus]